MSATQALRGGLVSVTFRALTPAEVVTVTTSAGLTAIEWGGDVHVPHGDSAVAREVAACTADAGLIVAAYGSYYRSVDSPDLPFARVLETAVALDAPTIRVWAGQHASAATGDAAFARISNDLRACAGQAAAAGRTLTLEYHGGTLTDTPESTLRLLRMIDHPAVRTGWQPHDGLAADVGVAEIDRLRPWLGNLHVFEWRQPGPTRCPLAAGRERWAAYLAAAADTRERFALLEFVAGDDPARLADDAATLLALL